MYLNIYIYIDIDIDMDMSYVYMYTIYVKCIYTCRPPHTKPPGHISAQCAQDMLHFSLAFLAVCVCLCLQSVLIFGRDVEEQSALGILQSRAVALDP